MIIAEIILRIIGYIVAIFGGYVLFGALCLKCSIWATEDDTWIKCIKKSYINTINMRPWYDRIDD